MKALVGVTVVNLLFAVMGLGAQLDQWEVVSFPSRYLTLLDVTYGAGTFVAVGESSSLNGVQAEVFISSDNAAHWTRQSPDVRGTLFGVTYAAGGFVVVGGDSLGNDYFNIILTSRDGTNWTRRNANVANHLFDVSYGSSSGFVAVGLRGAIATSDDGVVWSDRSLPLDPALLIHGIAIDGVNRVAVGHDAALYHAIVVTSADGIQWSRRNLATSRLWDVSYGNGRFVAVGENDTLLQSTDAGVTWSRSVSGVNGHHLAITFHDGIFVAVGYPGSVISSVDGANWQVHRRGPESLHGIAYGRGRYVAVDYDGRILRTRNMPPVVVLEVSPAAEYFSLAPRYVVISPNAEDVTVNLSGAGSYDPDADFLSFHWLRREADGSITEFAQSQETLLGLPLGRYDFTLRVSDGIDDSDDSFEVRVISASQAVGIVIALVEESPLSTSEKQPLLKMLRSAQRAFDIGAIESGLHHLARADKTIDARLMIRDPDLAQSLLVALNAIRNSFQ